MRKKKSISEHGEMVKFGTFPPELVRSHIYGWVYFATTMINKLETTAVQSF